jgi:peptide/nickel transport system permease protein
MTDGTVGSTPALAKSDSQGYWQMIWFRFRRHRTGLVGGIVLLLITLLAISAPLLSPYSYTDINMKNRFQGPSPAHIFGTDDLGRDLFTRIAYGGRVSLVVAFAVGIGSALVGTLIGSISGYLGGIADIGLMRFTDIMLSIPSLPILLIVSKFFGGGNLASIAIILTVFSWMTTTRLVRGQILSLKEREFILAADAIGAPRWRILLVHLIPNTLAPVLVSATLTVGSAVLVESSLSYLGLGVRPPTPSWGNMLSKALQFLQFSPWVGIFPGLFIFLTLLSVNLLGDALRDAFDPRLKV